jgi:SAM-dependent methyltransferase
MPKHAALYEELAQYYDQIYHWKDYRKEAGKLKALILGHKHTSGRELLDVACGTGKHLSYLRQDFDCVGIDESEQMLAVARSQVPGVVFSRGTMLDFDIAKQFDAILCLFSSFGYLRTRKEIDRAIANFARHLKNGGVLIIEPWLRKSRWQDRAVHMQSYEDDSLKIARVSFVRAEGALSVLDERYLIGRKGKGIKYVRDLHKMRFFELNPTLLALRKAGLAPIFTEDSLMAGRGLIIATRPLR